MRRIYKKISLESFRTRIPNTLISFSGNSALIPYRTDFFSEYPNGVYGAFPSDIEIPDEYAKNIFDVTNRSINLRNQALEEGDLVVSIPSYIEYYKLDSSNYNGDWIKVDSNKPKRYFTYKKLHNWYIFFKKYFALLNNTTCKDNNGSYDCAVSYYYSNNPKSSGETLEYFKNLDETFVKRGGVINDEEKDGLTHCDLYDWMKEKIFMEFIIPKKFQKEWKSTILNINALMQWYSWFTHMHELYENFDDCVDTITDEDSNTDCCECEEYHRLGGNEMYLILKEYVQRYFENAAEIGNLCTACAEINVPLTICTSSSVLGEFTSFIEEWEGGVDFSNQLENKEDNYGTVVKYGGTSFLYEKNNVPPNEDPNETITIQDSVFISKINEKKLPKGEEIAKGYYQNEYKELTFLVDGETIYKEYLPKYINDNKSEFSLKELELEGMDTYAYLGNKLVRNPSYENMRIEYKIFTAPKEDVHLFYIKNEIYTSYTANTVTIKGVAYTVHYIDDDERNIPYIEYKGTKYFGIYNPLKQEYEFIISQKICNTTRTYTIDKNENGEYIKYELLEYDDLIYDVVKEDEETFSVIIPFDLKNEEEYFVNIYGYIVNDLGGLGIIDKLEDGKFYYCNIHNLGKASIPTEYYDLEWFTIKNNHYYGYKVNDLEGINNIEEWDEKLKSDDENERYKAKRTYYFDNEENPTTFYYIEPYVIHHINFVTGFTASRLYELEDFNKTYDKMGSTMNGKYCGTDINPQDTDILDIYYHFTNTSNLSHIINENNIDYYWGNIISNIRFYYKDDNNNIITETIQVVNDINSNLNAIKNCIDLEKIYWTEKYDVDLEYVGYLDIDNNEMYCEITYNIGAIIERKKKDGKYRYSLSETYHSGVEFKEEFLMGTDACVYYTDKDEFYNLQYYKLNQINQKAYYMDEYVTDESEEFITNIAQFSVEINHNFTNISNGGKTSKFADYEEINSSKSDGRQFNFYNGLMASPNIMEEYNLGISSLRSVKENIYIDRGVNYAFDKHLKLLEVKSFEALEQYNNGFYNIISNNND